MCVYVCLALGMRKRSPLPTSRGSFPRCRTSTPIAKPRRTKGGSWTSRVPRRPCTRTTARRTRRCSDCWCAARPRHFPSRKERFYHGSQLDRIATTLSVHSGYTLRAAADALACFSSRLLSSQQTRMLVSQGRSWGFLSLRKRAASCVFWTCRESCISGG